jgi:hypothetical protein
MKGRVANCPSSLTLTTSFSPVRTPTSITPLSSVLTNVPPDSVELLLGNTDFIRQHLSETHTVEYPVSRPTLDVSNKAECETKINIVIKRCEEDASCTTVFEAHVGTMTVDGYVLVNGRYTVHSEEALKALFKKVNTWAREWKESRKYPDEDLETKQPDLITYTGKDLGIKQPYLIMNRPALKFLTHEGSTDGGSEAEGGEKF